MIRAFRYPLRPTKAQEATLNTWLAQCCELYNAALQERRDAWRKQRVSVTRFDQSQELTGLRADVEWSATPVEVQRSALARIDRAFQAFFRRVTARHNPGFPRFRSRDRYNSFSISRGGLNNRSYRVAGDLVYLPKVGAIRFHKYRPLPESMRDVRIHRGARGWSVSFLCDVGASPAQSPPASAIGVDVGLEVFATLSNGDRIDSPRFFRAAEVGLARRQQALAKSRRGSNSRKAAKRLVARAHERIRNQRLDFARKLAAALFSRFDLVAHEDLNIRRMVNSLDGHLAKSINDAAWGLFLRALQSKAESAGKWCVAVDPRGTSQACAACGSVVKKELSEREHRCDCGFVTHRDHNAALNVLARGLRAVQLTEAKEANNG